MLWLETYYCLKNINSYYLTKPKIPFRVYENKHTTKTFLKHGAQYSNVNFIIGFYDSWIFFLKESVAYAFRDMLGTRSFFKKML